MVMLSLAIELETLHNVFRYSLSKLSWRNCKSLKKKGIHLTENGSNKRHVILMGMNAHTNYQMPV